MPDMRSILHSAVAAAVVSVPLTSLAQTPATQKPNIVVIIADDLGYGDVGFNGQQHIKTPHLDAMARDGAVLTQHYAGAPVCMPSRCAMLTGLHTGHGRVRGNPGWSVGGEKIDLAANDRIFPESLKAAGYDTAVIGKWGLEESGDDSGLPRKHGFDYFYGYFTHEQAHHYYPPFLHRNEEKIPFPQNDTDNTKGDYSHDLIANEALQWVGQKHDKPFFLLLTFTAPHYELTVPDDSKAPYKNLGWPVREMKRDHYRNDADGNLAYAGMVSRMDRDIGRLNAKLKELGIDRNTVILFASDNGPEYEKTDRFFNSNGPFRGGKRDVYEGGIRVPGVVYWPGTIAGGTVIDRPTAFWDYGPTFCELAGAVAPQGDGVSFAPDLLGKRQSIDRALYWEFNEGIPRQAVRVGDWKLVRFPSKNVTELYNLTTDAAEANNLAEREPQRFAQMQQALQDARTDDPRFPLTERKRGNAKPD